MSQTVSDIAFIVIAGTVLMLLMSGFIVFMVVMHRNKQLKNRHQLLRLKSDYEHAILNSQVEIQNQTFMHVGRELHDNLGQVLSLIKLNLAAGTDDGIRNSRQLLATAIHDMRLLSKSLNLDWAEKMSLQDFARNELLKLEKTGALSTRFFAETPFDIADVQKRVVVFRIIQECLNNILKHASANQVIISISKKDGKEVLEISDDGIGFVETGIQAGSGLMNIRQRAALIGGEVQWESHVGKGTKFSLKL